MYVDILVKEEYVRSTCKCRVHTHLVPMLHASLYRFNYSSL